MIYEPNRTVRNTFKNRDQKSNWIGMYLDNNPIRILMGKDCDKV